jgi:hypothetical protein
MMAVADIWTIFENWLPLVNFGKAQWICRQWAEIFLMQCTSHIRDRLKNRRRDIMRIAPDFGKHAGKTATGNLSLLAITTLMVMIHWVSNGKNFVLAPKPLHALCIYVRHLEDLVDLSNKHCGLKEPYILTSMFQCTLEQEDLEAENMGFYLHRQMINGPIYSLISYNYCLSNAFRLSLGPNVKIV